MAVCFLWHFPAGYPGWVLPTTLPCGARTFLDVLLLEYGAVARPAHPRLKTKPTSRRGWYLTDSRSILKCMATNSEVPDPTPRHGRERVLHRRRRPRWFGAAETGCARRVRERRREAVEPEFRFSRIGPTNRGLPEPIRRKVAKAMTAGVAITDGKIPAGYTYLGQFIDHDLTFDKTVVTLGDAVSPADMLQGRSPTLDLDSLYGAGPSDPVSAKFYADDRHLLMGKTVRVGRLQARVGFDLPRKGNDADGNRRALIPDRRNDENLAVAQTHLAMIRFHNRVVDTMQNVPTAQRFSFARRRVVMHYQWMLRTDFLTRICDKSVVTDVFKNGRKIHEAGANPMTMPTMPIEFSVAAYRFGHSMVRAAYDWNAVFNNGGGTLDLLFTFSGTSGFLGGGRNALPSNWIADWRRLYPFASIGRADLKPPPGEFNRAQRIDTKLTQPAAGAATGQFRRIGRRPGHAGSQSGVPKPHPGRDGRAGHGAADGGVPAQQGCIGQDLDRQSDRRHRQWRRTRCPLAEPARAFR